MNNDENKRFNDDGSRNAYVYTNSQTNKIFDEVEIQNEINIPIFLIVNIILFIIALIFINTLDLSKIGGMINAALCLIIIHFYFICFALLIRKMGYHWWNILIPLYNIYLFLKLAFNKPIKSIIPYIIFYVGLAFIIIYLPNTPFNEYIQYVKYFYYISFALFPLNYIYKLGTNFGQSGILMILFGIILLPIISFSSKYYYVGSDHLF